jgi:hypothetical protein
LKKLSTEEFIEKASLKHNKKYSYDNAVYINRQSKIEIICLEHGSFFQRAGDHLNGFGCSACSGLKQKDNNIFILEAQNIHGNKYDYSKVEYKNALTRIEIICPKHGSFLQKPNDHLREHGCAKCVGVSRSNNQEFISRCKDKHENFYDYSKVEYKNAHTKIEIICPKHGSFFQKPNDHLNLLAGCRKCSKIVSRKESLWLDYHKVPDDKEHRQVQILLDNKLYIFDGFMPETNTVYEFNGDMWHGNPNKYKPEDINPVSKTAYKQLYENTLKKHKHILQHGYKLISIWESEWKKLLTSIRQDVNISVKEGGL